MVKKRNFGSSVLSFSIQIRLLNPKRENLLENLFFRFIKSERLLNTYLPSLLSCIIYNFIQRQAILQITITT